MKFSEFDKLVAASQSGKKIIVERADGSTFTFDMSHSISIVDVLDWKSWREAKTVEKTAYMVGRLVNGELVNLGTHVYKSLEELRSSTTCYTPVKLTWEVYE